MIPWNQFKNPQAAWYWAKNNISNFIKTGEREITFKGPRRFLDERIKL
jgi:hypothetical protein